MSRNARRNAWALRASCRNLQGISVRLASLIAQEKQQRPVGREHSSRGCPGRSFSLVLWKGHLRTLSGDTRTDPASRHLCQAGMPGSIPDVDVFSRASSVLTRFVCSSKESVSTESKSNNNVYQTLAPPCPHFSFYRTLNWYLLLEYLQVLPSSGLY